MLARFTKLTWGRKIVIFLAVYSVAITSLVGLANLGGFLTSPSPQNATVLLGVQIVIFWCLLGGYLMHRFRDNFKHWFSRCPGSWQFKFVIFSIAFALLEEAITVALTNSAPWYGFTPLEVHVTASTNYFHVVLGHSVILFTGWIVAFAYLLKRYDFPLSHTFLLFGLLGVIGESSFGWQSFVAGFWFFVYGLMIYLPAYSIPSAAKRGAQAPRFLHYLLAIVLPYLFMIPAGLIGTAYIYLFDVTFFPDV